MMFSKPNYSEDGIDWVFFDETKIEKFVSNHAYLVISEIDDGMLSLFRNFHKKRKIDIGFYTIKDISYFFILKKPLSEYLKLDNVGVMTTLPITRYNSNIYICENYNFDEFLRIIQSGSTFLLYMFNFVNGRIIVRGKKI
jgi:hypothetical protein